MDVTGAVSRALARSQRVLFRPFNIGLWFAFGFVFFLASLIDPIGGYSGRFELPDFSHGPSAPKTLPDLPDIPPEIAQHQATILVALSIAGLIGLAVGVVVTWVGCRGLMMSYRSVSMGFVAIGESWRETAKAANALFRFSLLLGGVLLLVSIPLVALAVTGVMGLYESGERSVSPFLLAVVPHLVVLGVLGLFAALVSFVTRTFIAPFLLFFPCTVREAWARFFRVLRSDPIGVVLFIVLRTVLAILVGVFSSIVATCTCCVGGLPVLHQTVLAPILFFDRAFTLHTLASIGPEYAMMAPELPPSPWQK
jgi:hypothetical protein